MSASLVGSEMCIRDSPRTLLGSPGLSFLSGALRSPLETPGTPHSTSGARRRRLLGGSRGGPKTAFARKGLLAA
eukprot:3252686-Alexandrium_andersonii.AAC.1